MLLRDHASSLFRLSQSWESPVTHIDQAYPVRDCPPQTRAIAHSKKEALQPMISAAAQVKEFQFNAVR
jgi:hypothetical protein